MKFQWIICAFFLLSLSFSSCWHVPDSTGDDCTECTEAMKPQAGTVSSGRLAGTPFVKSTAFAR
ncbi:MAG: hypothetical protein HKN76_17210 [Saprospiraceae bacterium]|nr:hypothetical protein [Saprospiraceae bacterium]